MKKLSKEIKKPWGAYYDFAEEKGKWHLKVIKVEKGKRLSLQTHKLRTEFWVIVEGQAKVEKNSQTLELTAGDTVAFSKGEAHRLEGISDTVIVEVTFGTHDEDDIER